MSGQTPNNSYISSLLNGVARQVLDLKNTSVESALRLMMTEFFKNDTLKNVQEFQGEIVRIVEDKKEFNFSPFNIINNLSNTNNFRYKVWIPDLGSLLINKTPSDNNPKESIIIDLLPDFVIADSSITNLAVKDIVTVSFLDPVNFKNGVIKSKANKSSTGEAGSNNNGNKPSNPSGAFPTPSPTPPEKQATGQNGDTQPRPDDIDLIIYKWDIPAPSATATPPDANASSDKKKKPKKPVGENQGNGNVVPSGKTIKGRKIPKTPSEEDEKYVVIEAAEAFKEMAKALKDQKGLTLTANSGYRGAEKQIKLFNERWDIKYEANRPKRLSKKSYSKIGGENALNERGLAEGVACEPSPTGPHLKGKAIDIYVGSVSYPKGQEPKTSKQKLLGKFKSDIYLWLKDNAYKYGFFNTGANIETTPEAWHWSYIKEWKGKKEQIILPPNSLEQDK